MWWLHSLWGVDKCTQHILVLFSSSCILLLLPPSISWSHSHLRKIYLPTIYYLSFILQLKNKSISVILPWVLCMFAWGCNMILSHSNVFYIHSKQREATKAIGNIPQNSCNLWNIPFCLCLVLTFSYCWHLCKIFGKRKDYVVGKGKGKQGTRKRTSRVLALVILTVCSKKRHVLET